MGCLADGTREEVKKQLMAVLKQSMVSRPDPDTPLPVPFHLCLVWKRDMSVHMSVFYAFCVCEGVTSGVVTSGGVRREEESEEEKVDLSKEGESEREREQPATEHAVSNHSTLSSLFQFFFPHFQHLLIFSHTLFSHLQ